MEPTATVCKARLSIADIDRNYYQSHKLTLAQQVSDTDSKTMLRLLAYIYNANDSLKLRQQQWRNDQPELWEQSLQDDIKLWIDLGQPELKRVKKACRLANKVIIYSSKQSTNSWWEKNKQKLGAFKNLEVFSIDTIKLEKLNQRSMRFNCTLQDGELLINNGEQNVVIERQKLL